MDIVVKKKTESKSNEKKLVDQLLQLIRIFVMTATEGDNKQEDKSE